MSATYPFIKSIPNDPGVAMDLVEARFGLSSDLVSEFDAASDAAIAALAAADYTIPMGNLDLPGDVPPPPTIGEVPTPNPVGDYTPQAEDVEFPDLVALRELLGLIDITIDQVTLPVLDAVSPTVNIPDAPDDDLPDVPTDTPNVSDPAIPTAPTLDMPPIPVLDEITLPNAPTLDNLVFEGEYPTMDLTPPEPMFVYSEATYQSDLADAINTKLYNDVTLGGTGLDDDVEQAIWDRGLARLNTELDDMYTSALEDWGAWNCDMPDGTLSGALREVAFEDAQKRENLNNEILIKQAELAQQNTHFAITNGLVYEKQIMDYTNQVNNRAFEVARYRVQSVIDAFNLKVSAYNAQMQGYQVLAQVFESRIRAELAKVEIYRAQMEGAKIHGELQMQKVAIYTARVNALNTIIDLYRAQMEGAKLQVDVDKARIDAFKARLDAVTAQIGAVTAKYNLYQAQIAGETAKVDLYGKQVAAFSTQMQAAKTEADINLGEAQAQTEANKDRIAILAAAVDKYKSDTQYELGKDETGAKVYTAQVAGYSAEVGREGTYLGAQIDSYKAQVSEVMALAELTVKEADANLRAATALKEIQIEALKALANITTQKVASALTSVSASAQIGFNGQLSNSYSQSEQRSGQSTSIYTTSDDYKEAHIHTYNETPS